MEQNQGVYLFHCLQECVHQEHCLTCMWFSSHPLPGAQGMPLRHLLQRGSPSWYWHIHQLAAAAASMQNLPGDEPALQFTLKLPLWGIHGMVGMEGAWIAVSHA
jgi:hypothetical protein